MNRKHASNHNLLLLHILVAAQVERGLQFAGGVGRNTEGKQAKSQQEGPDVHDVEASASLRQMKTAQENTGVTGVIRSQERSSAGGGEDHTFMNTIFNILNVISTSLRCFTEETNSFHITSATIEQQ